MKKLVSLAVVVAFFVTIPQCLGQSQDAEKDASQLLEEQQLEQMVHLAMVLEPPVTVEICHLVGAPGSGGILINVPQASVPGHLVHGDCEEPNFTSSDGFSCCCFNDPSCGIIICQ